MLSCGRVILASLFLLLSSGPGLAAPAQASPLEVVPDLLERLDPAVADAIGRRIWRNEAALRVDWLVHWLPGEGHASLGIGHFIWYPQGRRGPFQESFPRLLAFMEAEGVRLPDWLEPATPCPWPDRAAFLEAETHDPRVAELRAFLAATVPVQLRFMAARLAAAVPALLTAIPEPERDDVLAQLARVLLEPTGVSATGVYALIDYVNFKGEGVDPGERYAGRGWGLLQVLHAMAAHAGDGRAAFAKAAEQVLTRRVRLAPPAAREERWLPGWRKRVSTYRTFTPDA